MGIVNPNLNIKIGNLDFKNPVMTASGTFGYGEEFKSFIDLHSLGAIIVKGISFKPRAGNPPPRVVETASGMLNAIGLENVGVEDFIANKLPFLKKCSSNIIVNILGDYVEDYSVLAERLDGEEGVHALEVNISCPNVKKGGVAFGTVPKMAHEVTKAVRKKTELPVIVKLSPNVTDITEIAKAVEDGGADAVSLINTLLGMAIDINSRKPKLANIVGGLSGPAIKPVALRMVWQVSKSVKIPVIGIGGIATAEDAIEFLLAGATGIQIGTANFVNPKATVDVIDGIRKYLVDSQHESVSDIIGALQVS